MNLKILIVEDDEPKRGQVATFLADQFPTCDLHEARAFQSGLKAIMEDCPDMIVLDMSMATFDKSPDEPGGRFQPFAGREILRQMRRQNKNIPVVVLTQYDLFGQGNDVLSLEELDNQLRSGFSAMYLGAVYYNPNVDGWKEPLYRLLLEGVRRTKECDNARTDS